MPHLKQVLQSLLTVYALFLVVLYVLCLHIKKKKYLLNIPPFTASFKQHTER